MWTVIETTVNGTIRQTYKVVDENEVFCKTEASLESILERPLTSDERAKFHADCYLSADGRAMGYCASYDFEL